MARPRSVASRLYRAYRRRQQANAEARRRAERELQRANARIEREWQAKVRREQREAERLEREQQRRADQETRERRRQEAVAQRQADRVQRAQARKVAQIERDLDRRQAARGRERTRLTVEQRRAEVALRTESVRARVAELARLLIDRRRVSDDERNQVEAAFAAGGPDALVTAVHEVLSASTNPAGLHGGSRAAFHPESRELLVDYELPRRDAIPDIVAYRYVQSTDEARPQPRKDAETKALYRQLIARVALRTLADTFDVTPATLVDSVIFNGYVSAKDRATGKPIRPCLISVNATRDLIDDLVLDEPELDPILCLGHLNAIVSPHPYDLEPVRPVVQFDLSTYKFVEEVDVIAGLDSRPNLLDLAPAEFEHLVRALFEAVGMKAWITQASRDDGIDAVAVNEDPIVGGLCVIQAKRYKNIVGLESVHALAGAMSDKNATKGILVTTSYFGKASRDFVARNGNRMQLIDGRNLKSMLLEHLGRDVLIGLPRLPPSWQPRDIT